MNNQQKIVSLFPAESNIPEEFRIPEPLEQTQFLVNGEIHHWDGPVQDVFSPVCLAADGDFKKKRIGSYPLLTEKEALGALEAACQAYDSGRGHWPTMAVEGRIRHLEEFSYRMKEKREQVVRLLMWEIGKNLQDACHEFAEVHARRHSDPATQLAGHGASERF